MDKETGKKGQTSTPFLSIFLAGIVIASITGALVIIFNDVGTSYGVTYDNNFTIINGTAAQFENIANQSSSAFFANGTRTNQLNSIDRLVSAAYSSILYLGDLGNVFIIIINFIGLSLGLNFFQTGLLLAFITFTILSIAIWLSIGRR